MGAEQSLAEPEEVLAGERYVGGKHLSLTGLAPEPVPIDFQSFALSSSLAEMDASQGAMLRYGTGFWSLSISSDVVYIVVQ